MLDFYYDFEVFYCSIKHQEFIVPGDWSWGRKEWKPLQGRNIAPFFSLDVRCMQHTSDISKFTHYSFLTQRQTGRLDRYYYLISFPSDCTNSQSIESFLRQPTAKEWTNGKKIFARYIFQIEVVAREVNERVMEKLFAIWDIYKFKDLDRRGSNVVLLLDLSKVIWICKCCHHSRNHLAFTWNFIEVVDSTLSLFKIRIQGWKVKCHSWNVWLYFELWEIFLLKIRWTYFT